MNVHVNTGTSDLALGVGDFTEVDVDVDFLIMLTNGSDVVKDGEPIPSTTELTQAGMVVTGEEQTCDKYFLADDSANLLKQIHNMGAGNKRYVLAFDFDVETASEPVLEAWDDVSMLTTNNVVLGEGTPSSSWIAGVVTTDALPGVGWVGSRLAGSSAGHYLLLNNGNGALTEAKTLYANLKMVMPSTEVDGGVENPILVVKYTTT